MSEQRQDGYLTNQLVGFSNRQNGYNTGCDTVNNNFEMHPIQALTLPQLEIAYRSNAIISRIVDYLPEECGIFPATTEDVAGQLDAEVLREFDARFLDLGINQAFIHADKLARLYSDSFVILGINDGGALEDPVNENRIQSIDWVRVRDRWELSPEYISSTEIPEHYRYSPSTVDNATDTTEPEELKAYTRIHHSRIIRFVGKKLPRRTFFQNAGYNDSIIQVLLNDVLNYYQALGGGNSMLMRSGLFVYKMFGLEDMAVRQEGDTFMERLNFINTGLSVFKSLFIDAKKGEEAEYVTQNFGGVDKLIMMLQEQMIASSGYPKSIIMGSSNSSAFSEGGESDRMMMAQLVKRNQKFKWTPAYERLLYLMQLSAEFNVSTDSKLTVHYPDTYQTSPKEQAELEDKHITTDIKAINAGVLTLEEVRKSRYGGAEFSTVMVIDPDVNPRDIIEAEKAEEREFQISQQQNNTPPRRDNKPILKNQQS